MRPCAPHQGRHGLTGDAVNTAARLLKLAEAGDIVVGEDTWRMVSAHFEAERLPPRPPCAARAAALQPWRVLREVEMPPAAPLIGRDDELRHAQAALRACIDTGAARWVVIRGEPGIGKSRLLQEIGTLARAMGAAHLNAAVPDFGPARGEVAVRALLNGLLQLPADADAQTLGHRLADAGLGEAQQAQRVHAARPRRTERRVRRTQRWTARRASAAVSTRWWRWCAGTARTAPCCWRWRTCTGPSRRRWRCWHARRAVAATGRCCWR